MLLSSAMFAASVHAAGLLTPADGSLPALEITSQSVDVLIEDGYVRTRIEQVFHNPHDRDLEAVYSFPVPKHGSVAEFTMWIDGHPVSGEVVEKQQARKIYQQEKAAGREAGLTEKNAHYTFEITVFPVRAQQDIRLRLVYYQPAHVDTGIGRYVYPLEDGGVDEQKLAFWTANEKVRTAFDFHLTLKSAYPVEALRAPGLATAQINQQAPGVWTLNMSQSDETGQGRAYSLDKDIVVYWRLRDGLPGSVDLVAYKPTQSGRGTFMLVVTPGDDLRAIQEGKDWVFVLDISGSMRDKLASLAQAIKLALGKMRANDRFHIVLFNNSARELTPGFVNATREAVERYSDKVGAVSASGGTNLYAGLEQGLRALQSDRTSAIVLVTDGEANVGVTEQKTFIKLIQSKDVRLFTAIMGNSANEPLLGALTKASHGFSSNVSNSDDIVGKILEMSSKVTHQALHGAKLSVTDVEVKDLTPSQIGSLYRGQQLVLFGHYWQGGVAQVRLQGKISGQPKTYKTQFTFPEVALDNPQIERLWAYAKIEDSMDDIRDFGEDADLKQAVIDTAKEFGLVSDYTSMLVVGDEVFTERGIERHNKKRLAVEQAAASQRTGQPPVSRRVDQQLPMAHTPRPSYHGSGSGGAIGPWLLLFALPLWWWRRRSY